MTTSKYFAIIGTSRNACGGVRWVATAYNSESDIIGFASAECGLEGTSLEEIAGIEWVGVNPDEDGDFESFEPARAFADGEEFQAAITKLNDDGRTYSIFNDSSTTEVADFIEDADRVGLGDRAKELVEKFAQ